MSSHDPLRDHVGIRSTHLRRALDEHTGLAYRRRRYECGQGLPPQVETRRLALQGTTRAITFGRYRIVKMRDPLILGAWPTLLALLPSLWGARALDSRLEAGSYAIRNGRISCGLRVMSWLARKPAYRGGDTLVRRAGDELDASNDLKLLIEKI